MQVNRFHPVFAAEMIGADLASSPDAALLDPVDQAVRDLSLLVIRDDLNHKRDLRRTTISDPRLVQAAATEQAAVSA